MSIPKGYYRQKLPHYLPNDRPYFLTFRLAGSLPRDEEMLNKLLLSGQFLEYERLLHMIQSGPRYLAEERIAEIVAEAIHHRDGSKYILHAYSIMSNHVHMIIELPPEGVLYDILRELKGWTGKECNKILNRHGDFWQHEGYDHVIRKGRFGYAVAYVLNNPVKARIVKHWREHRWTYLSPKLQGFD